MAERLLSHQSAAHKQLVADIRELAAWLRLYVYSPYDSRRSPAGWPDLTIIGIHVAYREVKTGRGRPTPEQTDVMRRLQDAGADVAVWRDTDWRMGTIQRELYQLAARAPELGDGRGTAR